MDMDFAHYMLTEGKKVEEETILSPSGEAYRKKLAETLNINRTRIPVFKNKPPAPVELIPQEHLPTADFLPKTIKHRERIPGTSERTLDAPDLVDDFYLNLLDWGSSNVLAIALESKIYLWDDRDGTTSEFVKIDDEIGPITSVNWAPDGCCIAVGLNNSEVQLYDYASNKLERIYI